MIQRTFIEAFLQQLRHPSHYMDVGSLSWFKKPNLVELCGEDGQSFWSYRSIGEFLVDWRSILSSQHIPTRASNIQNIFGATDQLFLHRKPQSRSIFLIWTTKWGVCSPNTRSSDRWKSRYICKYQRGSYTQLWEARWPKQWWRRRSGGYLCK